MSWFGSGSATGVATTVSSWFTQYITPHIPAVVNELAQKVYDESQSSVFLPAVSAVFVPYTAVSSIRCFKYGDRAAGLHLLASSALLTGFAATQPYKEVAAVAGGVAAVYLTGWYVVSYCLPQKDGPEINFDQRILNHTDRLIGKFAEATRSVMDRVTRIYSWTCVACEQGTERPNPYITCSECNKVGRLEKSDHQIMLKISNE